MCGILPLFFFWTEKLEWTAIFSLECYLLTVYVGVFVLFSFSPLGKSVLQSP